MGGHARPEIVYHRELLVKEGYLDANVFAPTWDGGPLVEVTSLSWKGHDLLNVLRDEKHGITAMREHPRVGYMPLEVISKVLTDVAARLLTGLL
jgi:hypothetical protein